jgi:O-antigen ligase
LLRNFADSRSFALGVFVVLIGSTISLYLWPQVWLWALLLPAALWGMRLAARKSLGERPLQVWALIIFVVTAAVGYWAAYDEKAAWEKFCLIVMAVLFYLIIAGQPRENLKLLAGFWFVVGVGIAAYFLMTFDFTTQIEKFQLIHQMGLAWMKVRPISLSISSIHPNDASGIAIITAAYGLFLLSDGQNKLRNRTILKSAVLVGLGIVCLAVILASSRGAFLGLAGGLGVWTLWRVLSSAHSPLAAKLQRLFPFFVVIAVLLVGGFLFAIPFGLSGSLSFTGGNISISRLHLFRSGLWILRDFPFTGGGLNSFPGLFSQYVLVIPYYSILNSHNMFLDVMIEQGIPGGLSFLLIYLIAVWQLLSAWRDHPSGRWQLLYFAAGISLFTTILHGMVDDYVYGGQGTLMALISAGLAVLASRVSDQDIPPASSAMAPIGTLERHHRFHFQWFSPRWMTLLAALIILFPFTWKGLIAQWYANIGSVKMAKIDLANYPANRWYDGGETQRWAPAETYFRRALAYQPDNRTAHHRLGLISLMNLDFLAASDHLLKAYQKDSADRGVIKNLGYSYLWLGEIDKAQVFLTKIPEAKDELDAYVWWWGEHGQPDLADHASIILPRLTSSVPQNQ